MDTTQWIEAAAVLAVVVLLVRRNIRRRAVPRISAKECADGGAGRGKDLFLDVRTGTERSTGNIPGSLHIPLHELPGRLGELDRHRNKRIICYCQSGSRSLAATTLLLRNGFTAVSLDGGIAEWNFHRLG